MMAIPESEKVPDPVTAFDRKIRRLAEQFIRAQVDIMKRYGTEPHIDPNRYAAVLRDTQRTFKRMAHSRTRV